MRVHLAQNIYSKLMDDISKRIFEERLLYSISKDPHFIRNIIRELTEGQNFEKELKKSPNNYIFGAGAWGKELAHIWGGGGKAF